MKKPSYREKAQKVARAICHYIADQAQKAMTSPKDVDFYFDPVKHVEQAMDLAFEEGYKRGRQEVLNAVKDFDDTSKDPKDN